MFWFQDLEFLGLGFRSQGLSLKFKLKRRLDRFSSLQSGIRLMRRMWDRRCWRFLLQDLGFRRLGPAVWVEDLGSGLCLSGFRVGDSAT